MLLLELKDTLNGNYKLSSPLYNFSTCTTECRNVFSVYALPCRFYIYFHVQSQYYSQPESTLFVENIGSIFCIYGNVEHRATQGLTALLFCCVFPHVDEADRPQS